MVPARLSSFVNLSFSPLEPGNFYKRVYLLLRNQAPQVVGLPSLATPFAAPPFPARRYTSHPSSVLPLQVIHLYGSGYTEKRRPMPITPAFVSDYQIRELRGGQRMAPEELLELNQQKAAGEVEEEEMATYVEPTSEAVLMRGLFRGSMWAQGAVALEDEWLDFGAGSRLRIGEQVTRRHHHRHSHLLHLPFPSTSIPPHLSRLRIGEQKSVRLFNRTNGKMAVQWVVPDAYAGEAGAVFAVTPLQVTGPATPTSSRPATPTSHTTSRAVTPLQTDILPKSSATFKVQFRPNADGQYYAQTLEAFCSFKSMRTFRLVTEESFALPWCLSLSACGHTFAAGGEHFIPKSLLSHRRLTFPACHAGDAAYQTVSLMHDSNTPRPPVSPSSHS